MINSKTSFLALIGNPVEHSLSPIMHNAVLEYLNLDLIYLAIPCKEKDFNLVINSLKKINCKGLNITIPFKEKVFPLCEEISPIAKKIKAINTLKINTNGEWSGINTDVDGFLYPLAKYELRNKKSIILGSGGAARSVIQGLINLKVSEITIISRNKLTLNQLSKDFDCEIKIKTHNIEQDKETCRGVLENADLIVNTTPIGMKNLGGNDLLPFGKRFWESMNRNCIVYDLIYNPAPTALLDYCEKKGCEIIDGREMLIAQGAKSLSYWINNQEIPIEIMRDAIKNLL